MGNCADEAAILTHDAERPAHIRGNMLWMSAQENRSTPEATKEAELARAMRERLIRCAALSALCLDLRDQVRKKTPVPHGSRRPD